MKYCEGNLDFDGKTPPRKFGIPKWLLCFAISAAHLTHCVKGLQWAIDFAKPTVALCCIGFAIRSFNEHPFKSTSVALIMMCPGVHFLAVSCCYFCYCFDELKWAVKYTYPIIAFCYVCISAHCNRESECAFPRIDKLGFLYLVVAGCYASYCIQNLPVADGFALETVATCYLLIGFIYLRRVAHLARQPGSRSDKRV